MGKNFIEKLFYFLERPPPTREHEWEHHMVRERVLFIGTQFSILYTSIISVGTQTQSGFRLQPSWYGQGGERYERQPHQ